MTGLGVEGRGAEGSGVEGRGTEGRGTEGRGTEGRGAGAMSGLFALPPGVDFAAEFVAGLLDRMAGLPPQALARVVIYANSGRTAAALRERFEAAGALLLPQIRLIANLGLGAGAGLGVEPALAPADADGAAPPPPAAALSRRMELARLVEAALRGRDDGQNVAALAETLAALMAEMQLEGLGPGALDQIAAADHAAHWQRALGFLRIATGYYLDGPPVDRESRQRRAVEQLLADWAEGRSLPAAPVIVVGSTGSHGATRLFMQALAGLENGAVVLPAFDFAQPAALWETPLGDDHPQARYQPFVSALGLPRRWTATPEPDQARGRVTSLALRPAPVTDQWINEGPGLGDLPAALAGLTLIEADTPAAEADAIAALAREAVERGQPVTLIAADRMLTRRVTAALDRWRLIPDDSAGRPLPLTAAGLFLRHVAALFGAPITIDVLLVLLKHPLTATGRGRDFRRSHLRLTRELELHLREHGPAFPDGAALVRWAGQDDARSLWAAWVGQMLDRSAAFAGDRAPRSLSARLADLRALAEGWAAGPAGDVDASALWQEDPGEKARAVMDELARHVGAGPDMTPGDFATLLVSQLQGQTVRADAAAHPLIRIRGPREARTEAVGLVVLAGLNEGGWPQALPPDPWLSRQMRRQAGLPLPERQIGLAAHDFQIGLAASQVVLTRARRDSDAETIPSRWLNRLLNLIEGLPGNNGPDALRQMRARGKRWLTLARAIGRPADAQADPALRPAQRPSPVPPPGSLRSLSVTGVKTLIRDPYAIYASRILRLRPLPPLRHAPDAAERGTLLHRIVHAFMTPPPAQIESVPVLVERLMQATDRVLAEDVPWPATRGFWRARIARLAEQLMTDERARLSEAQPTVMETRHRLPLAGMDFALTAQPDRIDITRDGRAIIHDYKSGRPPSDKEIAAFDKQLPLEAAMMARGAFGPVREVAGFDYIQLGDDGRTHARDASPDLIAQTWDGFVRLIDAYVSGRRGYTARAAMQRGSDASDYDHLARFGEWGLADLPVPQPVGQGPTATAAATAQAAPCDAAPATREGDSDARA